MTEDFHEQSEREERRRYWRETFKQRNLLVREVCYTLIAFGGVVLVACAIWGFLSWKNANNAGGTASARVNAILEKIDRKVDEVDAAKLNDLLASGTSGLLALKERTDGLRPIEENLAGLIATLDRRSDYLAGVIDHKLDALESLVLSLRDTSDESRAQLKGIGGEAQRTLATANRQLNEVGSRFTALLGDGSLVLQTSNEGLKKTLDATNRAVVSLDGRIQALAPIEANAAATSESMKKLADDIQKRGHQVLFPEPKHGWARVGQVATYVFRPVLDGMNFYYQVQSLGTLPVRIVNPIPK